MVLQHSTKLLVLGRGVHSMLLQHCVMLSEYMFWDTACDTNTSCDMPLLLRTAFPSTRDRSKALMGTSPNMQSPALSAMPGPTPLICLGLMGLSAKIGK